MLRRTAAIAIAVALVSSCVPSAEQATTSAPTTNDQSTTTNDQSTTAAPPEVQTTAVTTTVSTNGTSESEPVDTGPADDTTVELTQYGLRFTTPPPFVADPTQDYDYFARSQAPRGLLTIADCTGCELSLEPRDGETRTKIEIDGVPALVVENAALSGLPPGVTANELIVVDDQRAFSVIMSFEGDIGPPWKSFIDSIKLAGI